MKFVIIFILSFILSAQSVLAQKVYTREELEKVLNPSLLGKAETLLEFDSTEINAGVMSEDDEPLTFSFNCKNVSKKQIAISKINTTCGCTVAEVENPVLEPGDKTVIKVVFNPFGHPGKAFLRTFVYSAFSEKEPVAILTVNGEVAPSGKLWKDYRYTMGALKLRNKTIDFGSVDNGDVKSERIACANSGSRPLKVTVVKGFIPSFIDVRTEPAVLAPSEEGVLIVELKGDIPSSLSGKKKYKVILDGPDVRPSERTIEVSLEIVN